VKERKKEEVGPCYNCKKQGHMIADYLNLKATTSRRMPKKKAMMASWDDSESDSGDDIDVANVCFMAHGDDPTKVTLETSLDDSDITMDILANFFEEL